MYPSKFNSFVRGGSIETCQLLGHTTRASDMREPSLTGTWKVVITIVQGDGQQTDFTYLQANTSGYFASTNALRQFRNTTESFVHHQITDVVATYQYA